jgi:hypothetical protein
MLLRIIHESLMRFGDLLILRGEQINKGVEFQGQGYTQNDIDYYMVLAQNARDTASRMESFLLDIKIHEHLPEK